MDAHSPFIVDVGPLRIAGDPVTLIGAAVSIGAPGGARTEHVCFIAARAVADKAAGAQWDHIRDEMRARVQERCRDQVMPAVIYL